MTWAAWRARPLLWGIPLALLLVNFAFFTFYRIAYAGKVEVLQSRFEAESERLAKLRGERETFEDKYERIRSSRQGVSSLYLDHFSTEAERFTAALAEIRRLGRASGLEPTSFSYPNQDLEELELRTVGFSFNVEGTYDQLRRFINLLELSDHFLVLERVGLNAGGSSDRDPRLSLSFAVSTVFASEGLARRTARAVRQAALRDDAAPPVTRDETRDTDGGANVDSGDEAKDEEEASDDEMATTPNEETAP